MGWNGFRLFGRTRGVLLFEGFIGAGENLKLNGTVIVHKFNGCNFTTANDVKSSCLDRSNLLIWGLK